MELSDFFTVWPSRKINSDTCFHLNSNIHSKLFKAVMETKYLSHIYAIKKYQCNMIDHFTLLISDVIKIFLFCSRLRFSWSPSISLSISLSFSEANQIILSRNRWDLAGHPHFHCLHSELLNHQAGDQSNFRLLRNRKIGCGILSSSV